MNKSHVCVLLAALSLMGCGTAIDDANATRNSGELDTADEPESGPTMATSERPSAEGEIDTSSVPNPLASAEAIVNADGDDDLLDQLAAASRCNEDSEFAPIDILAAEVDRWVRADGVADGFENAMSAAPANQTVEVALITTPSSGDAPEELQVFLASSEARAIERVLALGRDLDVWLALGDAGFVDGETAYLVAAVGDDRVAFVGGCSSHYTDVVIEQSGGEAAAAKRVTSWIGKAGGALVAALSDPPPGPTGAESFRQYVPGLTDPEQSGIDLEDAEARTVIVQLVGPGAEGLLVCAKADDIYGSCVDSQIAASLDGQPTFEVVAYANPTSPVSVEVVNEAVESFPFALATSLPAESFVDGRTSEPILVDAAKVLEP